MKAFVEFVSIDPGEFLADYEPEEPDCFGVLLIMGIGTVGEIGTDYFHLLVCTPRWLESAIKLEGSYGRWGYHHLIVLRYDPQQIESMITESVGALEGDSWDELTTKLRILGYWEYEDGFGYPKNV